MRNYLRSTLLDSADSLNPKRQPFYVKKYLKTPEHEIHIGRQEEIAISRIRSGHYMLNHVLNRFDPKASPLCTRCLDHNQQHPKTAEHVILVCPSLNIHCREIREEIMECSTFQDKYFGAFLTSPNPSDFDLLHKLVQVLLENNIHY